MNGKSRFFTVIFVLIWALPLYPQQFMTVGGRAAGMGGAYVAVADDFTAAYWNPAAAALIPRNWAGGFAGAHYADIGGLVDTINDIIDFNPGDLEAVDAETVEEALALLKRLQAQGLRVNGESNYGFSLGSSGFAFSLMDLWYGSVYPVIDLPDPAEVTDWGEELRTNPSGVYFRGLKAREFVLTTSRRLGRTIFLGSNLKYIQGRTYALEKRLFDDWSRVSLGDLVRDAFEENRKNDNAFGIDLGFLVAPINNFKVGLVCRNLNKPNFPVEGDREDIELARQCRLGFALGPPSSFTLAMDVDLSGNVFVKEHPVENKEMAVGLEKRFLHSALAVRGGFNKQFGDGESLNTYTAGLGVALGAFNLEFGGAYALEKKSYGMAGTLYLSF